MAARQSSYPMVSVSDATNLVLEHAGILFSQGNRTEVVSIDEALHRTLAVDVHSGEPLPPFRASVKDGYAVIASDGEGDFAVVGASVAGSSVNSVCLTKGKIARITTGAPVPEGADAVVMIENTELIDGDTQDERQVRIKKAVSPGTDIRPIGSDIAEGELVLKAGEDLGAAEIGILATVGITQVKVISRPVIAVLSTGDELVEPTETPSGGQIRDSNRHMLLAAISDAGRGSWQTIDLGIAGDSQEKLESRLKEGLRLADVLITSGGVSMGHLDLLKPLLEGSGTVHFGRVNVKPGKPCTFATLEVDGKHKLVLATPGNPVSSLVTFNLFGAPALRLLSGKSPEHVRVKAKLLHSVKLDPQRPEYYRATVSWDHSKGHLVAQGTGRQASSRLLSMRSANALLALPQREGTLVEGEEVEALMIGRLAV